MPALPTVRLLTKPAEGLDRTGVAFCVAAAGAGSESDCAARRTVIGREINAAGTKATASRKAEGLDRTGVAFCVAATGAGINRTFIGQ